MMQFKMTKHATEERMERMVKIAMNVGWGEIVLRRPFPNERKVECLTSTGVFLCLNEDETTLITAFVVTIDKAIAMSEANLSKELRQVIRHNTKKGYIFF